MIVYIGCLFECFELLCLLLMFWLLFFFCYSWCCRFCLSVCVKVCCCLLMMGRWFWLIWLYRICWLVVRMVGCCCCSVCVNCCCLMCWNRFVSMVIGMVVCCWVRVWLLFICIIMVWLVKGIFLFCFVILKGRKIMNVNCSSVMLNCVRFICVLMVFRKSCFSWRRWC